MSTRVAFAPLGAVRPKRTTTTARAPVAVRAAAAPRVSAASNLRARKQTSFAAGLAGLSAPVRTHLHLPNRVQSNPPAPIHRALPDPPTIQGGWMLDFPLLPPRVAAAGARRMRPILCV